MVSILEKHMRPASKGVIPTVALKPIKGLSFAELEKARYETYDLIVPSQDIKLDEDGVVKLANYDSEFKLTPFAATGFAWCSNTGDRKCETDDAAKLITKGFAGQDRNWRLRITENDLVVAIVSEKYVPLQNSEVIDGILKLSTNFKPETQWEIHPEKMAVALTAKKKINILGEEYSPGTLIKNGEHGKLRFSALGRIVRYICTNGMVLSFGEGVDIYREHEQSGNWEGFDIHSAVNDIVGKAMSINGMVEHLEEISLNEKQRLDTMKRVIQIGEFGVKQADVFGKVYDYQRSLVPNRTRHTMYDIYNAATGMKDEFPKTRSRWEELGGQIIIDPTQFAAINN